MRKLSDLGRIFYGVSIAELGIQTVYYNAFPYFLIPPNHLSIPGFTYISGALLALAGAFIAFGKKVRPISLLVGAVLLAIFCFWFVPYQFIVSPNYMHLGNWENAEKELALAGGAFAIAVCFPAKNESNLFRFLGKIEPLGAMLYAITIISFGILHFQHAKEAADYVPEWIPSRLFWVYLAGVGLLGAGIAILLRIWKVLAATLLGSIILIWFLILHIPRVVISPSVYMASEASSAFLALALSGIAFVIAGTAKKKNIHSI